MPTGDKLIRTKQRSTHILSMAARLSRISVYESNRSLRVKQGVLITTSKLVLVSAGLSNLLKSFQPPTPLKTRHPRLVPRVSRTRLYLLRT